MPVVLIAEDDPDVSFALELIFKKAGFQVRTAADGMIALRTAVEHHPDVVLTDLDMPRLTGLELCHALRGHRELHDTPVAMLSGSLTPGDPRALDARLCAVLLKPFSADDLVAAVRNLVETGLHDHTSIPTRCPYALTA